MSGSGSITIHHLHHQLNKSVSINSVDADVVPWANGTNVWRFGEILIIYLYPPEIGIRK